MPAKQVNKVDTFSQNVITHEAVDVLIGTPMRLVAGIQRGSLNLGKYGDQIRRFIVVLMIFSVRHLILDEADRMLDREFYAQITEIVAACTFPHVQKGVFSATLPASAEEIAMNMMSDPVRVVVGLKYVKLF